MPSTGILNTFYVLFYVWPIFYEKFVRKNVFWKNQIMGLPAGRLTFSQIATRNSLLINNCSLVSTSLHPRSYDRGFSCRESKPFRV